METLIDICVPVWNCDPAYFKQAIDSTLAQTETRWKMYIHDDASSVDMEAMVNPYLSDPRISWHPNRKKLGIGGNWNATMRLGSSPFVQFLFPDDWWEKDFLAKGLKILQEYPSVGIVSLGHSYVGENGADLTGYNLLTDYKSKELKAGIHNGMDTVRFWAKRGLHPNIVGEPDFTMYRRSVMEQAGPFLEDMRQNLDVEYAVRCLLHSDWYNVTDICGHFRIHAAATSAVNQREGKGVFDRFRCLELLIKQLPSGADRTMVIDARNDALTGMARNYLKRLKDKKIVSPAGGGAFKKFAMRHPLLILRAMWRAII